MENLTPLEKQLVNIGHATFREELDRIALDPIIGVLAGDDHLSTRDSLVIEACAAMIRAYDLNLKERLTRVGIHLD
jgi:hypothetical protein